MALYLAGSDDLDRAVACPPWHPNNLVPVNRDRTVIRALRASGTLALHEMPLSWAVGHWPSHTPIDFVWADFTGGLTDSANALVESALMSAAVGPWTTIAVAMLRGRESGADGELLRGAKELAAFTRQTAEPQTHRGELWWDLAVARVLMLCKRPDMGYFWFFRHTVRTVHWSYQSDKANGMQMFDVSVGTWPFPSLSVPTPISKHNVPGKIAAFLAHRSRR